MNIGFGEFFLIAILLLVLYGKRLPEITRAVGHGLAEIKRSLDKMKQDLTQDTLTKSDSQKKIESSKLTETTQNQVPSETDKSQSPYKDTPNWTG